MIDALHLEMAVQRVPVCGLIGVDDGPLGDPLAHELESLALSAEHGRQAVAVALADDDDRLALAVLIEGEAPIDTAGGEIGRLHVAAEVARVDFRHLACPRGGCNPSALRR